MTATEHPESVALRHPGATQSPEGSQGAPEGPRGAEGATGHGISAVPHLETAPLPSASDVRPVPPARDAELVEFEAVSAARYEAGLSAEGRAARHAALAWGAEFRTKPNPDQPDRCPSIDPHDTLQCTRRIHEDGQCQSGGIAWVKGTPRYMSDAERANRMEGMAERLAALLVDVEERLTGERDRALGFATRVEAENARLAEEATVSAALLETEIAKREAAEMRANRATADLDAVRAALTSDDPAVMRAMAERVGLTVETREWVDRELTWDGGWTVIRRYERARVCGPWREVPNAD